MFHSSYWQRSTIALKLSLPAIALSAALALPAPAEAKTITAAEAREHKFRNVLWKYLGSKEVGEGPDVPAIPVQPGDRFLLCTDGLHGVVSDEKLLQFIMSQTDMQACADGLGQLALDSGSRDNVSCITIEVT